MEWLPECEVEHINGVWPVEQLFAVKITLQIKQNPRLTTHFSLLNSYKTSLWDEWVGL